MPLIVSQQQVRAPAATVWDVLTDIDAAPTVFSAIDAVDLLNPGPFRVGLAWNSARRHKDSVELVHNRVVELEDYRSVTILSETASHVFTTEYSLAVDGGTTTLTARSEIHAQPGAMIQQVSTLLTEPWAKKRWRSDLDRDLADIARAATD